MRSMPAVVSGRGPLAAGVNTLIAAALAVRIGFSQSVAAWPVLLGRCGFFCLLMIVLSALWDAVAAQHVAGAIALPSGDLALYVGATEWITLALPAVFLRLEDDIRGGGLEPQLLRPKPYLLQTFAMGFGNGLSRLVALGVTALLLLAVSGRAWPPGFAFAALLVLGPLALTVGLLLYGLAGLAAFWARRTLPFQLVIQKLMFLAGGLFAPVTLYPPLFEQLAKATPFAAHLYWAGAQILSAQTAEAPYLLLQGIAWQLFWIVVLACVCVLVWRAGLAKLLREGSL